MVPWEKIGKDTEYLVCMNLCQYFMLSDLAPVSMSRKGNCYDNAPMVMFHHSQWMELLSNH